MMKEIKVTLTLRNYIAHPFWPERNRVIDIEKKSGVNRQKSDEKRAAAIKAECEKQGFTVKEYEEFKILASEQFYRKGSNPSGINPGGAILIPRHQIAGGLVQGIGGAPKALRGPFDKDNFRALVDISDFQTELTEKNGDFARFVKLEGSNQRSFQSNEFIGEYLNFPGAPFEAVGSIACDQKQVDTLKSLFTAVLENVGIGAARKMGFGRGSITSWK